MQDAIGDIIVISDAGGSSMPSDLSMWDISPKSGKTPLTINWGGYLIALGYAPIYDVFDGEYLQLQLGVVNSVSGLLEWIDVPAQTVVTAAVPSPSTYHGAYMGSYVIPITWPVGVYQFRVLYAGNAVKGIGGSTSPIISVTLTTVEPPVCDVGYHLDPITNTCVKDSVSFPWLIAAVGAVAVGIGVTAVAVRKKK